MGLFGWKKKVNIDEEITVFTMRVVGVFTINGVGIAAAGYVDEGIAEVGYSVSIVHDGRITASPRIKKIDHHDKTDGPAKAGQNVALFLEGITADRIKEGDKIIWVTGQN